uniref:Uncharacterized protein n=1 Tax=Arundo donax TaxID=35708 RepID=A0A0A9BHP8_ARUDO
MRMLIFLFKTNPIANLLVYKLKPPTSS